MRAVWYLKALYRCPGLFYFFTTAHRGWSKKTCCCPLSSKKGATLLLLRTSPNADRFLDRIARYCVRRCRLFLFVTDRVVWFVGWSVCLSVCLTSESCKNGWNDQDAVWVEDLGGPAEPCIRWGSRNCHGVAILNVVKGWPIVKCRDTLRSSVRKRLN